MNLVYKTEIDSHIENKFRITKWAREGGGFEGCSGEEVGAKT